MKTTVVNIRKEPYDVYIGRAGKGQRGTFGNPIKLLDKHKGDPHYIALALAGFQHYFVEKLRRDPKFKAAVLALRGKRLGCFCKPGPCHGDIIAAWVDAQPETAPDIASASTIDDRVSVDGEGAAKTTGAATRGAR